MKALNELIKSMGLNQSLMAKFLKISATAFNNKLRGSKISYDSKAGRKTMEYHFSEEETRKLLTLLTDYRNRIDSLLDQEQKIFLNGTGTTKK